MDVVPDPEFHLDSVGFGSSLQFDDDSSGFSVNSGLSFNNKFSGQNFPLNFELKDECFDSHIPLLLLIDNEDKPVLV